MLGGLIAGLAVSYCTVDLSDGATATRYPYEYSQRPEEGRWSDEYRTDKLVLRRVDSASPYYIGVFEVTQRQYELVTGKTPSKLKGAMRPVECVAWDEIRGETADENTFIGRLRARTGLAFDLPTEAQWEYACRAGETWGQDLKLLGRYSGNCNDGRGGFAEHTTVGSYAPNAWGIYDMHGNVWEWCREEGGGKGIFHAIRGGCWAGAPETCTATYRNRYAGWSWSKDVFYGFRVALCCPCVPSAANQLCSSHKSGSNPIAPEGKFLADPAGRVGPDGELRLFCSHDDNPKTYCSTQNDVLSSSDLSRWKLSERVFASESIGGGFNVKTPLYAPDGIFHNGKWWLFYCTPYVGHAEGVAVSDRAEGPYGDAHSFGFCRQIDPSVFRDDDGSMYLYWGQFSVKCARLERDFSGLVPGTVREAVIDAEHHHFHEGVQVFKRGGIYYLTYADVSRGGVPSCIGYSTAPTPFGPFIYRGVIIDNAGCDPHRGNNHGSVVEFGGKWYVFYHRQSNGVGCLRKACVEPIEFDADGLIREVEMTSNGAGAPLDPFRAVEARLACLLEGNVRVTTLTDGQERLTGIRDGDSALWRYFDFDAEARSVDLEVIAEAGAKVRVLDGDGIVHGEGVVPPGDGKAMAKVTIGLVKPFARGRATVKLMFTGEQGRDLMQLESFTFLTER